ncbi:type VII secretion protein EccB [Actinomadura parmotrematis]|uniref:Type VII secretion protein EccB n=1 Tax=Actinomadura parmotrematis TaxID=2864039 RepID=A0ABS7FXU6_9ACTN|nr:type VII secretion protein EccB [Actinomadura parmotrematis]MBW8485255.1 type VII secretion protein EccB [Actinomadura parmotrematis]
MQSRRDLYQAHRLMQQRVGLALLQGEPDIAESPMKRLSVGAFSGVMVALVVVAVFGIWGLLSPGGARGLDQPGKLIIEKETGTKYVYDATTKKMFPVANYASAMLALNSDKVETRSVSRKSLARFARGPMIGIVGAPDSLPDTKSLVRGPWSVCVREAPAANGVKRNFTALAAGTKVGGRPLGDDEAAVVQTAGIPWVIWKDHRMQMGIGAAQVTAVTGGPTAAEVPASWLNAIPAAGAFKAPDVPGRGTPRSGPGGRPARVGQVFKADTGDGRPLWYVMLRDGLAQISQTQAQLLLRDPVTTQAYGGQTVQALPVDVASAQQAASATRLLDDKLPPNLPKFLAWDPATPLCTVFPVGSSTGRLTVGGSLPAPSTGTLGAGSAGSATSVDQMVLPPGGASLISLVPTGSTTGTGSGSLSLVNDQGVRYALPSADVAKKLGYDAGKAAPVPASVIQLIPSGPALDPALARQPVSSAHG